MRRLALALAAAAALGACDAGGGGAGTADGGADAAAPDATPPEEGPCGPVGERRVTVLQQLRFAREAPPGVAAGLDLDGRVSAAGDPAGCGHADFADPDGRPGVDNQLTALLAVLDELGGSTVDEPVETAIRDGELLLLVEVESAESLADDACVSVNVLRGLGTPTLGTDGRVLAGQTFDLDVEQPWSRVDTATIAGGRLRAGPFPLKIPLAFFDTRLTVDLAAAWLELDLDEATGEARGVIGAVAPLDALGQAILDVDTGFAPVASALLDDNADLWPDGDGACRAISLAFEVRGVRAHLYADTPRPAPGTQEGAAPGGP